MLIVMAVWDTEENKRTSMTAVTLRSLADNVDWTRHRLVVSDNGSCAATQELYNKWYFDSGDLPWSLLCNGRNIGTAAAINRGWRLRRPLEHAVKMDNDVVFRRPGWADAMEEAFRRDPTIGIVGLKRVDLEERPDHEISWYRSTLRMLPHEPGQDWLVVEECLHIMGTCQAYSCGLLNAIGYLYQLQDRGNLYGFDDSLASIRAHKAGFKTVFLHGWPIDHIDPGGTQFTQDKMANAGLWLERFRQVQNEYLNGTRPLWWEDPA